MMIHISENGHSFELDCQPSTSVEAVQNFLASLTGIPQIDQLLIVEDTRLEPQRLLGSYQLPAEGRPVFLFNRQRLSSDSAPPPPEVPEDISEIMFPPPPSASHSDHSLDEAPDPALRALPSYERQFKYHFQKGNAVFNSSQRKFEACRRLLREQQVQQMALETARGNMDHYYKIIDQIYKEFMKHFTRQHRQHSDLLANIERDLDRLRACKLHPALRTETRKTLLDCMKEGSVRKWADDCAVSHKQFYSKVLQLKSSFTELQRRVEELFVLAPTVDVQQLEHRLDKHVRFTEEQASIIQSLSKDVNTVKKLIDECVSSQFSASLRPHDAVSALGPMYDVHDKNHLPKIEACDLELKKLLDHFIKSKNEMSLCVHKRMQNVAALQSSIRNIRNQLSAFKEAMARQDDNFEELKLVRKVGSAYKACLAEVVRRKACMKLYMGQAGQLAEKMAERREAEIARREEFLRVQSAYIPRDVIGAMGLFEIPSQCVVNIAPFDSHLLDIDVVDLEHYAPESLVGPLSKPAESESEKLEGSHVIAPEELDQQIDQDRSSNDIVGTSKLEVENAWLKAELASAIAMLCSFEAEYKVEAGDDKERDNLMEEKLPSNVNIAQKTAEALKLKDEHAKHLKKLLSMKNSQCNSYEKRIQELEHRLREQHIQLHNLPSVSCSPPKDHTLQMLGKDHTEVSETSGLTAVVDTVPDTVEDSMDDMANSLPVLHSQQLNLTRSIQVTDTTDACGRAEEGRDESISEFIYGASGLDASMAESRKKEPSDDVMLQDVSHQDKMHSSYEGVHVDKGNAGCSLLSEYICGDKVQISEEQLVKHFKEREQIVALESELAQKTKDCIAAEERVQVALAEIVRLGRELESNGELLRECQMNSAHLENRLHEAREEARTHLCAADRRASEYNSLRTSYVKLRGLMERLKNCIAAPVGGVSSFVESLRALSTSLNSSSLSETGEDVGYEFRVAIRVLSERVGALAQQRNELVERCTKAEASQNHLSKELENKTEMLKNLYAKRQQEKLVSKEKICFTHFEVHELAMFMPNAGGHYEAVNHNCPNYYLSDESIDLFMEHLPKDRHYIVGQIVHIDRNVARDPPQSTPGTPPINSEVKISASSITTVGKPRSLCNPYSLPVGTEYFLVTVALVPEFASTTN